jgi:hypothetical protein
MSGLLSRVFGTRRTRPTAATQELIHAATLYTGHEPLEVVGESHYQEALWRIVGGRTSDPVRYETVARLLPDPGNAYDPNAVEVRIDGALVGYLSRQDAVAYRPGLLRLVERSVNRLVALRGVVVGGGPRRDGIGYLGVFLDHDPADFGLPSHHTSTGLLRTGLSEAIATDLEDDDYDLSWYQQLSENDATAIAQLRSLLESEHDPIDRHYVLCELEHRLYKARSAFPSALDEFDAVCSQHDAEMVTIRPVLLGKFGAIPVIEMYRQSAIRCQKAKRWQAARDWAERGIAVYGGQPARPEVVDDLHKRIAYASAKIAARQEPIPRAPRATTSVTTRRSGIGEIETLVCSVCGASFERARTRGRKPKACPACRAPAASTFPA